MTRREQSRRSRPSRLSRQSRWQVTGWTAGLAAALATAIAGATPAASAEVLPDPRPLGAKVFQGWAFDTCHAPSLATLRAWNSSRYRAVGVYYAGRGRACASQPNLTVSWMRGVKSMKWRVLPIFVGSQAPCVRSANKKHVPIGSKPFSQGRAEGKDAVARAKALSLKKRSALYLDMEAYDLTKTSCAAKTLSFIRGWNREVRSRGFFPGFYSSAESGVRHLEQARRAGVHDLPSAMWFARWKGKPSLYGEPTLAKSAWNPHRRIHQYKGNVDVTHGGRKLRIDRNKVDAPVAIIK
ncbi:hypothetical protein GCM10017744_054010 [Streptomyces antimycoticus]|uniref:Rv2525c-like glycoside hydrolase-like domain-containing protein n=1 Tax=Streptomyces antimycoticus TaxID=68175 RepID=A0A4D4KDH3_9ACTN|nr:DUF1906 domain-containing protein [Streptomyces antimycoticus]GDY43943.1 hypothetical protein SANT12839_048250 [Streptomyces antimycoticus]